MKDLSKVKCEGLCKLKILHLKCEACSDDVKVKIFRQYVKDLHVI